MFSRVLSTGSLAAAAGFAMMALTAAPASAFTLSSPSLAPAVAHADIDQVWWRHRWHRHYWHRDCWRGPRGHLHCHR
jgi:hypothetical protein